MPDIKNSDKQGFLSGQGIDLRELWAAALKRKWIVIGATLAAVVVAVLLSFLTTPIYTAEGQVLIEREPKILSFEDIFQIETYNDEYYQTQYNILQSRALAGATIDQMRLYENKDFVTGVFPKGTFRAEELKNDPRIRSQLITQFLDRLSVRPVRKTRLIQAGFSDPDPELAAEILDAFFEAYIEMNIEKKFQASEQATDFLTSQIQAIRTEIEANERRLQEYGKEKNIIALSSTENTVVERLGELNKALTDAQIDRINKETYYNEVRVATPDHIPAALSSSLIQRMAEEYNRLYREYVKRSEKFLPEYPDIQRLKAELDAAKQALEDETQAQINRAYTDFQAALSREQALASAFNRQRREAFQLNSNAILYNSLLIEIQNGKNLLESLMKRKSETDVSASMRSLRTSNIWVVDRAEIPLAPSHPNKPKNIALGLVIGLFVGLTCALLLEGLDATVKNAEDIRIHGRMPMLGMIPSFLNEGNLGGDGETPETGRPEIKKNAATVWARVSGRLRSAVGMNKASPRDGEPESMELIVHFTPKSAFAEYYRSIRTTLLLSAADGKPKAFAITSPLPKEGKTLTTCNLAVALAQAGKRVVIIDADLRKPRLHKIFRVKNLNGLTKYLTSEVPLEDLVRATPIPMLFMVNSGPVHSNPLELLGTDRLAKLIEELKKSHDFVLVDTPPVLPVSDALVLGSRLDGTILVLRAGSTPRKAFKRAQEQLVIHNITIVGAIINNASLWDMDDHYYRAYYRYRDEGDPV